MKIFPILLLAFLLTSCSETNKSQQVNKKNTHTILTINQSCSMLGLDMTPWKSTDNDGVYRCISNYIDIPPDNDTAISNNLSYYVQGTKNTVNEFKIVLNINNKNYKNKAKNEFIIMSKNIYKNIESNELPNKLIDAISSEKDYSITSTNLSLSIENDIWENSKGLTQKFIIHLK